MTTKLGALALSLLPSANGVSECLIYPHKITRQESSKCVVIWYLGSVSHVLGCWQCFFVIFPFHIQLQGLSGGFWSVCHMKFIRGDRGKQLNVVALFLSIVEICDGDCFLFCIKSPK